METPSAYAGSTSDRSLVTKPDLLMNPEEYVEAA